MWFLILMSIIIVAISAGIGYLTNVIAVRMLFHPKEPVTILGYTIQGIFPKRQLMIAQKVGKVVAAELLSVDDLKNKVMRPETMEMVFTDIQGKVDEYLFERLPRKFPVMSLLMRNKVKAEIRSQMLLEVRDTLPDMLEKFMNKVESQIDIEAMIAEKFSQLSSDRLEQVMKDILSKEFRFIELIGLVIGFVIGLVQMGIFLLSQ